MLTLPLKENNHSEVFTEALRVLKSGGIVAYPTESFYALGVMVSDEDAVRKLFELKKRPAEKPLPVIVPDINILESIVNNVPEQANELMDKFWPGPLTMIFEAVDSIPELLTGRTGKIAVRIPGRSAALDLAEGIRMPVTATSANPSSQLPAETPDVIINYFGDNVDLIIDAGTTPGGKPSTIVDVTVTPFRILRNGSVLLK